VAVEFVVHFLYALSMSYFRPVQVLIFAFVIFTSFILVSSATARSGYRLAAQEQYLLLEKSGKGEITCAYCHTSPNGGAGWNKFGQQLRDLYFGEARRNVGDMLFMALRANKDADADGYTDVLEVVAKTLPGDAASKPAKSVADLQAELTKLGGLQVFMPKR
jgi:hypothetical protein